MGRSFHNALVSVRHGRFNTQDRVEHRRERKIAANTFSSTSRQTYNEAVSLLYSDNRFQVPEENHHNVLGPDTPIAVSILRNTTIRPG